MHPTAHLKADIAALKAEVARLSGLLAPPIPEPAPAPLKPVPLAESHDEYEARQIADRKQRDALADARVAKQREGLPRGYFRDPCGLVRDSSGKLAAVAEREAHSLGLVQAVQGEELRAYRQAQGLGAKPAASEPNAGIDAEIDAEAALPGTMEHTANYPASEEQKAMLAAAFQRIRQRTIEGRHVDA